MTKTKRQLRAEAVERLKNNVGARFSPGAIVYALLDGRCGSVDWSLECDAILDLLTDDDGVARSNDGATNLDWLYENDDGFAYNVNNWVIDDGYGSSETWEMARKWLMAPHVDANDYFTPKTDVSAGDVDANDGTVTTMPLKVPSETIVNGERVRGIPKIGWSEQTAEKMEGLVDSKPICSTQDAEPTNCTTEGENDAQAAREHAQTADADSREKLEADVRDFCERFLRWDAGNGCELLMLELLDRQAEITKAEQREWWGGVVAELTANQPTSQSDARETPETGDDGATKGDMRDFDDSREKLEADVREWIDIATYKSFTPARMLEVMNHWLDRRAEITRKTEQAAWIQQANGLIHEAQVERDEAQAELRKFKDMNNDVNAECAELQERVDNLKAERDALQRRCENQRHELGQLNKAMREMKLAEDLDDVLYNGGGARDWYMACQEQAKLVEMLERRNVDLADALAEVSVDELTNKNMQLAHELGVTLADRDEYRALVGQMLDAAQEIRRIADANMPSGARVVVDYEGEVIS